MLNKFTFEDNLNGNNYEINFVKKENHISINLKENNIYYEGKLALEDIFENNNSKKPINLVDVMKSLTSLNSSGLKMHDDYFIYSFNINIKENIKYLGVKLYKTNPIENSQNNNGNKKRELSVDFNEDVIKNHNIKNIRENLEESKFFINIQNKIIDNNFQIIRKGDNFDKKNIILLNKKRLNNNEFSIFNNNNKEKINETKGYDIDNDNNINYQEHKIYIQGIEIKFPYEPYEEQIKYMEQIILNLNLTIKREAMLESPHGTGKTLSLLCSILSWNENLEKSKKISKKILYCTKTKSQINNIIQEIGKIKNFYDINYCILLPRKKLCPLQNSKNALINQEEENIYDNDEYTYNFKYLNKYDLKIKNEDNILQKCQKCSLFQNSNNIKHNYSIIDIEDLKINGYKNNYCPFYYMKNKLEKSNIIIISYCFLLNYYFKDEMKIESLIKDSIVIMDEAHSLLKIFEQSNNISIEYQDIIMLIELIINSQEIKILEEKPENFYIEKIKESVLEYLFALNENLIQFYYRKENNLLDKDDSQIIKIIRNLFNITAFKENNFNMKCFADFINANNLSCLNIKKLKEFISMLNSITDLNINDYTFNFDFSNYKIEDINFKITINCLNTSKQFKNILSYKPYRLIFTSGNLSPFSLFESELCHKFIKYECNHIISNKQLIVKYITSYKLTENINKAFPFKFIRSNDNLSTQYKIIGNLLYDLSIITPGGIIMFFSSYKVLNDCINDWKEEDIYDKINSNKKIVVDNTRMILKQKMLDEDNYNNINYIDNDKTFLIDENNPLISYKRSIDDGNGGIFLSLFKGKVSRAINFKGKYGRMVINIGIPFINYKTNKNVIMKEKYYNKIGRYINDWRWDEAIFKVNQSCGRIIRNKNDYGVIINIDIRNKEIKNKFCKWIRNAEPKFEEYIYDKNKNCNIMNNKFIQEIKQFFINQNGN